MIPKAGSIIFSYLLIVFLIMMMFNPYKSNRNAMFCIVYFCISFQSD